MKRKGTEKGIFRVSFRGHRAFLSGKNLPDKLLARASMGSNGSIV